MSRPPSLLHSTPTGVHLCGLETRGPGPSFHGLLPGSWEWHTEQNTACRLWGKKALWLLCLHNRVLILTGTFSTCQILDMDIMIATCFFSLFWRYSHFLCSVEGVKYQYGNLHSWAEGPGCHSDPDTQSSHSLCLIVFLQPFTKEPTKLESTRLWRLSHN